MDELKPITRLTLSLSGRLPKGVEPDILFIDSGELPPGELMPGIILFNAPANYIPMRAFVSCVSAVTDFVIQDGEQTVIFSAGQIGPGYTCLNPDNGLCPPFQPTLNLSCQGNQDAGLRIVIEYQRVPM